jgi:hypothetical protein
MILKRGNVSFNADRFGRRNCSRHSQEIHTPGNELGGSCGCNLWGGFVLFYGRGFLRRFVIGRFAIGMRVEFKNF